MQMAQTTTTAICQFLHLYLGYLQSINDRIPLWVEVENSNDMPSQLDYKIDSFFRKWIQLDR